MPRKNGSENIRSSLSSTRKAIESLRPVTRERAARFGTYEIALAASSTTVRACSLTFASPRSTRLAVARETPARAATSSSVGATRAPLPGLAWVLTAAVWHAPLLPRRVRPMHRLGAPFGFTRGGVFRRSLSVTTSKVKVLHLQSPAAAAFPGPPRPADGCPTSEVHVVTDTAHRPETRPLPRTAAPGIAD